jgi:hypothetical protein
MGQVVYREKIESDDYTMSISEVGLCAGIYVVKLSDGEVLKLRVEN